MSIINNVANLLMTNPETRNSDQLLMTKYWEKFNGLSPYKAQVLYDFLNKKGVNPETIRRSRQLIQADGYCLPTNEIVTARRLKEKRINNIVKHGEI